MANGHGGKRTGSGRKAKSLADKLLDGNPSKRRPIVVNLPTENADSIPRKCPEAVAEYAFYETETLENVYERTVSWLEGTKCLHLINPALIEEYSILKTRWLECEFIVSHKLIMSDYSGNPIMSEGIKYLKAANEVWDRIWAIVAQNSSTHYGDAPNRDAMARLLNSKPKAI